MSGRKPTGWIRRSRFSHRELYLVIFVKGKLVTSRLNFRIPITSLERLLYGEIEAIPVFDEVSWEASK